jgi:hypothetical protein
VPRISFRFLLAALMMTVLTYAQPNQKIDINLASASELQKLPGVSAELAKKIVSDRPYSKPADLRTAGLSESQIQQIQPLIKFGNRQQEVPAGQGGFVASVPLSELYQCVPKRGNTEPTQVLWKITKESEAAAYIPRTWFTKDGNQFSQIGTTEFSDLMKVISNESGKRIEVVEPQSDSFGVDDKAWTRAAGNLMVDGLRTQGGTHSIEILPVKDSTNQSLGWSTADKDKINCGLQSVELSKAPSKVKTLILVLPPNRD